MAKLHIHPMDTCYLECVISIDKQSNVYKFLIEVIPHRVQSFDAIKN